MLSAKPQQFRTTILDWLFGFSEMQLLLVNIQSTCSWALGLCLGLVSLHSSPEHSYLWVCFIWRFSLTIFFALLFYSL
jgi:hypothetical protein